MKLLIVDDEVPARERLHRLVDEIGDCQVVAEAGNGNEALTYCDALRPDVVLLDVRMPGGGAEMASAIAEAHPSTAVVIVTGFPEDILKLSGAFTILPKPFDGEGVRSSLELRRAPVIVSS